MKSWRYVAEIGLLSIVLGLTAGSLLKMRTPGWWVAGLLSNLAGKFDYKLDLRLFIVLIIGVDGAICFAILWGGYLLWKKVRGAATRRNLEAGK